LRSTRLDLIGLLKLRLPLLYKGEGKTIINISSEAASITNVGSITVRTVCRK